MIKHVYRCEPVDFWSIFPGYPVSRINEILEQLEQRIQKYVAQEGAEEHVSELVEAQLDMLKDRKFIVDAFQKLHEEFRGEDAVIPVVDGCELLRAYLVKADNNGTTYLFSPVAMDKAPGEEMNV